MKARLTPMLHVPDVRAAALWYRAIGFDLVAWHACDADQVGSGPPPDEEAWDWALVRLGAGEVMFNIGGVASNARRREVDLYVQLEPPPAGAGVDALYARLKPLADRTPPVLSIVEGPYDAFHGNRELIVRDLNGFWITFAQPVVAAD